MMKGKRHLLLAAALSCTFCLSFGQGWWRNCFITGMLYDPPMLDSVTAMSSFRDAIAAGFNLFTGESHYHNNADRASLYHLVRDTLHSDRILFLATKWLDELDEPLDNFDGKYIWDEPEKSASDSSKISSKAHDYLKYPQKLCYVNLFPYYRYSNWNDFKAYLDMYCDQEAVPLPVLCFDNYYPHSCFKFCATECEGKRYYSNLAEMRRRAGDRPLWSYLLTTEWMTERDTAFQRAYLRLSAFAPVAYGAKGILCYSYDCRDRQKVVRVYDYRTDTALWAKSVYFKVPDAYFDTHRVFFGNFAPHLTFTTDDVHPDIGVKTDEAQGKWHFKYNPSDPDNKIWDETHTWFGTDSETIPFIVYDQNRDVVAAVSVYKYFHVAPDNTSWTFMPLLPDFDANTFQRIDNMHVAAGRIEAGESLVLMLGLGDTVRLYHDYVIGDVNDGQTDRYNKFRNFNLGHHVFQLLTAFNEDHTDFYAVCSGSGNNGWSLYSYNPQDSLWTARSLTANHLDNVDHFWMEEYGDSTLLCMQIKHNAAGGGGDIYYGRVNSGSATVSMTDYMSKYSYRPHRAQGVRNRNGGYDLYYSMIPEYYKDGVVDHNQAKTARYHYLSTINHYIRQHLAPIVMNNTWKGCYHATALPDAGDSLITIVDSVSTPVIKSMESHLMAGIFEGADSIRYIVVVNKGDSTLGSALVTMRGRRYSVVEMIPRIDTDSTAYTTSFNAQTMGTTVSWTNMTGGECVILKVKDAGGYFNTHRNSFFDSDSLADINHRFNDGTWKIDYSSNGLNSFDASYVEYGNDSFTYPIPADYNGDGITDLALFQYLAPSALFIDYSTAFGTWDINQNLNCNSLISYIGRFDNDNKADVAYVVDNLETLYIRYADDSFGTIGNTLVQYGSSEITKPAVGDYDGDGLDDLATYHFSATDSVLLIDYNRQGGLQGWDQSFPISGIPVQRRAYIQVVVSDYDGDGKADFSFFDPVDNTWNIDFAYNGFGIKDYTITMENLPTGYSKRAVASDYDGDGIADMSLYVYSGNTLNVYLRYARNGFRGQEVFQY